MTTLFFGTTSQVYIVQCSPLGRPEIERLEWLLNAPQLSVDRISGSFIGPRREMVTPWSTNATEMTSNMGIVGVTRIECFTREEFITRPLDPMLESRYRELTPETLLLTGEPEPSFQITDIAKFNLEAGLALSAEEIEFLKIGEGKLNRPFTDTELFAFSQINSEHCRHKIFNGTFIIDGEEQPQSLFAMIKSTTKNSPENVVSAYKDNVAFLRGPEVLQFAPKDQTKPDDFNLRKVESVISLKAETHNFPTTVEPFNGASTGSGGEIRDRMAGGRGSLPLVGSAVYLTSYPRLEGLVERVSPRARHWKFHSPEDILIKASNGASDFGNKFGQPLITGSIATVEMETSRSLYAYDRCVMLAGGVGYGALSQAKKGTPSIGDLLIVLGGDNYRIGMAGSSVSSADSGSYTEALELSAVQRSNPEMQKRVYNAIRALTEREDNPIKLIHDHGAGGHINCFAELLDPNGGKIFLNQLPSGDATLSAREILCNESQERLGLVISAADLQMVQQICERERAPLYVVGEVTDSGWIIVEDEAGTPPLHLPLKFLFGAPPKTVLRDSAVPLVSAQIPNLPRDGMELRTLLKQILGFETVACKDWLTNKVDRSVTGLVAAQQCIGPLQLPLNNVGITALDYTGASGIACAVGHASVPGLIDERAGSCLSVAEALTNIVWAPLENGLSSVALSANWMWPAKRPGEDARLYRAVEALSKFAIDLGIPVPTGKDSLSMTMNYQDGLEVRAPGTVIVSAVGVVSSVRSTVTPSLSPDEESIILYIDLSGMDDYPLGGSVVAQLRGVLGGKPPTVKNPQRFRDCFNFIQSEIRAERILSGHDVSSGGLIVSLCEMAFASDLGLKIELTTVPESEILGLLLSEKPGLVVQISPSHIKEFETQLNKIGAHLQRLGSVTREKQLTFDLQKFSFVSPLSELRSAWLETSHIFDRMQTQPKQARERRESMQTRHLSFQFPKGFTGQAKDLGIDLRRQTPSGIRAAIIREKGTNGDRELAFALFAAGFDVRDVTMSDLMQGRESLNEINFILFPGGFANSDVLGAGKGWAGAFRYNENVLQSIRHFFSREDTLSMGVCNGCQLVAALEMLYPEHEQKISMRVNESSKFESAFLNVEVGETNSVFFKPLQGSRLGVWVAHGEGRFHLPAGESAYDIPLRFVSSSYPQNPNGSDFNAAAVSSRCGRHLILMPHPERSVLPWQWGYYPEGLTTHEVSPWMLMFTAARDWVKGCK